VDAYLIRAPARDVATLRSADSVRAEINEARHADRARALELGEDWAALHFLLSGDVPMPKQEALAHGLSWSDDSAANVLMGGEPLSLAGSFGPARLLAASAVALVARRLGSVDPDALLARFDPAALDDEGIPPGNWANDAPTRARLRDAYARLRDFYRAAADAGDAVLVHIT
jgi:hypothetical protein